LYPTFFELLGNDENALTLAVGWTLCQSPHLLKLLLHEIFDHRIDSTRAVIRLQGYQTEYGYTDIEIDVPSVGCCIMEAKRGWNLPSKQQLTKYVARDYFLSAKKKRLVVLSECIPEYIRHNLDLPESVWPFIRSLTWRRVIVATENIAPKVGTTEKRTLRQMASYLEDHTTARDPWTNWVFVVALRNGYLPKSKIFWIEVVEKKRRYFHPVGGGWPANPPTYMGFRYHGKLQSIHFVQSHQVVSELKHFIPEIKWGKFSRPHFLYKLSKPIRSDHDVKTGGVYGPGHVWCALDLLLTSKSISEAQKLTRKREEKPE
jgi:hypothetical protein